MSKSLVYSLVQYLRTQNVGETFYANIEHKISTQNFIPDRRVLVKETGGIDQPWTRYVSATIQILCRDIDYVSCRTLAHTIYNQLHGRFGLILPAVTVAGVNYDQIITAQINGLQKPFSLGLDENGREQFTTNYQVIYVEV